MSIRSPMLLLGAGLLSLSVAASAQSPVPPSGGRAMHPPADRAEFKANLEKHFDAADADHDGSLTPQERKAKHAEMRSKMRDHVFAKLDTDKNGAISKAEFDAGRSKRSAAHHGRRGPHGMMAGHMMLRHQLAGYRDKPITKTAFVDAGLGNFDRLDTDHDGKISPAERDAARKDMRNRLAPAHRPAPPPPGL